MAAGRSPASESGNTATTRRHFTLAQADRTLPLVRRIVRDIVNTHERASQLRAKLDQGRDREGAGLQEQLDLALGRLRDYTQELDDVGVELEDYQTGLVNFPGRHQGRDVFLSWKLGEERVEHWRELHGFAGRKSATLLDEAE